MQIYHLQQYGDYEGKTVNVDRVPDHESLVPVIIKAPGTIRYKPVYTYMLNGEMKTYKEQTDKFYSKFKRKEYYKGVVKELRITKTENDIRVVGSGYEIFSVGVPISLLILGVAQTIGLIILISNGIWTFV